MPELIEPTVRLYSAWREAHEEWGPGAQEDGFGLLPSDDVHSTVGFSAWLARLAEESDPARTLGAGRVHCTYRWIVEDDQVLGAIALRHELTESLLHTAGHVGYGVRPSARGRGLATWALGQMLSQAQRLGLCEVLLVCQGDNTASARTIEHHGGVLEDIRTTELGTARRYWITLR